MFHSDGQMAFVYSSSSSIHHKTLSANVFQLINFLYIFPFFQLCFKMNFKGHGIIYLFTFIFVRINFDVEITYFFMILRGLKIVFFMCAILLLNKMNIKIGKSHFIGEKKHKSSMSH